MPNHLATRHWKASHHDSKVLRLVTMKLKMLKVISILVAIVVLPIRSLAHRQHEHVHHQQHQANHVDSRDQQDRLLQENENFTYCGATDLWEKDFETLKEMYDTYYAENGISNRKLQGATINIPVYIHILTNSQGRGDLSDRSIADQMNILNDAFAPTFSFSLVRANRVANTAWFENCLTPSSSEVQAMTSTLKQGGAGTLNFYTCDNQRSGVLGRATFPFFYLDE